MSRLTKVTCFYLMYLSQVLLTGHQVAVSLVLPVATFEDFTNSSAEGGLLPIVGYTGRLCPKGVPWLSSQFTKG